jgi:hypothetical protein
MPREGVSRGIGRWIPRRRHILDKISAELVYAQSRPI